jgi:hypothetical protein
VSAERDLAAEQGHAEFTGWMEAQGHPYGDGYAEYGRPDMAEAFAAGMRAARDLAAATDAQPAINAAYRERAHLVAHLAAQYPSSIGTDPAEPEYRVVYVQLPTGQVSWHVSRDDSDLISFLLPDGTKWDGHDTDEKYRRLDDHTQMLCENAEPETAKVIIVTAPANGSERRYDADEFAVTDGTLFVNRQGVPVACHPAGTWTSFRFGDAIADNALPRALHIARRALTEIVRRSDDGGAEPFGRPEIGGIASTALNDIWETEG